MCNSIFLVILNLCLVTLNQANSIHCQQLVAVQASATLPTSRSYTSAEYDGYDTIYILGGNGPSGRIPDILQYSISTDSLTTFAASLPRPRSAGTTSTDSFGNIYYAGGWGDDVSDPSLGDIFMFSPTTNEVVNVSTTLPKTNFYSASITREDDTFIFGGSNDIFGIVRFNMANLVAGRVANLPQPYQITMAAINDRNGSAIIFGNDAGSTAPLHPVLRINLDTLEATFGSEPNFPVMIGRPVAMWDEGGGCAYIIGGYGNEGAGFRSDSILQWSSNDDDMTPRVIPVANFPVNGSQVLHGIGAVWVERFRRIYFFGGFSYEAGITTEYEDIWWIDMSSL